MEVWFEGECDTRVPALLINLSSGGAALTVAHGSLSRVPRILGRVGVAVTRGESVELLGFVRWVSDSIHDPAGRSAWRFGVQFVDLSAPARRLLHELLDSFRPTVLVLGDEVHDRDVLDSTVSNHYRVLVTQTPDAALATLATEVVAVLVVDYPMPDADKCELTRRIAREHADVRVILIGAAATGSELDELLTEGLLSAYLEKPVSSGQLAAAVSNAVELWTLRSQNEQMLEELQQSNEALVRENAVLRALVPNAERIPSFIGQSEAIRHELQNIEAIAESDRPVHVFGETGTGKELVAHAIHRLSRRRDAKFMVQNCAALSETLLLSTLFGHRRGAFTGAHSDQIGLFEAASPGTVFLDEIGDMSPAVQAACLRVLEYGEIVRLGDTQPRKIDVRIVSATNRDLKKDIEEGRFRKDLYYRLVVVELALPPLRERIGDVPLLATHFLALSNARTGKRIGGFEPQALAALDAYAWPGNVRQLANEIERLCIMTPAGGLISFAALSPAIRQSFTPSTPHAPTATLPTTGANLPEQLGALERELLTDAMTRAGGNKTHAAQLLGVSRQRLTQRLARWRLLDAPGTTSCPASEDQGSAKGGDSSRNRSARK